MRARVPVDREKIAEFCRKWKVTELSLFGSVLRDDFRPDSDVDVLVEFEPGHTPGLAFIDMEDELTGMFGRRVDLVMRGALNRRVRKYVLSELEVEYATER